MSRFPKKPRLDGNDLPPNNNNNNNNHNNNNREEHDTDHDNDFGFDLITHEDARGLIADSMSRFHQNNSQAAVVPNIIPVEPGELEVLPTDAIENNLFIQGFLERESLPNYSQESVASGVSFASLNEDARSLPSFASTNSGMNLDSPAGSQPQSNAASLPIQYPNSQGSVSSQDEHEVPASSSFLDRIQNTYVEPSALQALLQNIRNGAWPENN